MKKKSFKIELSNEAEIDFDKSYEFYTLKSEKNSDNFYKSINSALNKICKSPSVNPKIYKEIRKLVLKKFPFVIYYQIDEMVIRIIAIFHTSRNPNIWLDRIENTEN
jgi:toxin ParE1/3/4